jgi:hypothetical protein
MENNNDENEDYQIDSDNEGYDGFWVTEAGSLIGFGIMVFLVATGIGACSYLIGHP